MLTNTPNGLLIKQIHDKLEKNANNILRSEGLTMMQISVLMLLQQSEKEQLSMKELEQYFKVAQSTIVGIISRLEQKKFVKRFNNNIDKRIKLVCITPTGKLCCKKAAHQMNQTEKDILHNFSEDECKTLNYLLTKIIDNLK